MLNLKLLPSQTFLGRAFIFLAVLGTYYLMGHAGLRIASINNYASPIWLSSGLAAGSLILLGRWLTPAIWIGAFLVNHTAGMNLENSLLVASGNTLEAYTCSLLTMYFIRKNFVKDYSEFFSILLSALVASAISATLAITTLYYHQDSSWSTISYAWYTWWSGDAVGIILLLPLFLEFIQRPIDKIRYSWTKIILGITLTLYLYMALYLVFVDNFNHALAWTLCPVLIVLGLVLGRPFARIQLVLISLVVVGLTMHGHGPFELGDMNQNLIYVQGLLCSYAMAVIFIRPLKTTYKIRINYIFGIFLGWLTIFSVIYLLAHFEKKNVLKDFQKATAMAIENLENVSDQYKLVLAAASGLVSVEQELDLEEWETFVRSIQLQQIFTSLYSIGFIAEVNHQDLKQFEKKNHKETLYFDKAYSQNFNNHYIIKYLEPHSTKHEVIGFDLGSSPIRREAITQAKETGIATATMPITLRLDKLKRKSFLLLHPVWNAKQEFLGLTFAPIVSSIFFGKAFRKFTPLMNIEMSIEGNTIYQTKNKQNATIRNDHFIIKEKIKLFGKTHLLEFYPTDLFFRRNSGQAILLALILNLFMLFLCVFLVEQFTFGQRAEEIAEKRAKELELSRVQLINASKMASLGEMASGLAHEINNPLAIIQGKVSVIDVMLEDLNIKDKALLTEVSKIRITTERIEKIIKGLKNFSRSSTTDPFELTKLERIFQETLDLCAEKFKAEGIKIEIGDIPNIFIPCRPSQISQVLINLLNNASDAIIETNDKWINISFKESEHFLTILVTDSGKGISPEIIDRIMEPFFTTKSVHKGTGLGLSITKSIIESHGGHFRITPNSLHTQFIIELPRS